MSLLLLTNTKGDGRILLSATFYKPSETPKEARKVSEMFKYLYGPGVAVPWRPLDNVIKVNVCPDLVRRASADELNKMIRAWEPSLQAKGKSIEVQFPPSCLPYSDVNEHSLFYVNNYLTYQRNDQINGGFTTIAPDMSNSEIFDADIVMLGSEMSKQTGFEKAALGEIVIHEMGHFLGLDHKFDGTPSIMSYKDTATLQAYDKQAIEELYSEE